jgi:hypothetical protein
MYSGIASDMEFVEGWFMVFNATFNDISVHNVFFLKWYGIITVQYRYLVDTATTRNRRGRY